MSDVKELNINNTTYDIKAKTVVDNNGTKLSMWSGTKQEYDNIATKDPNQLYFIEDDADTTLTLLELLFPVGAVYFGTMSTCPLQTLGIGTWQALPPDKVIQIAGTRGSVGDTLNESLPNIRGKLGNLSSDQSAQSTGAQSSGALYWSNTQSPTDTGGVGTRYGYDPMLDASRSSSTYQDNAPVQQDAYLLNGWRRIA